jgi:hypothetical protein
VQPGSLKIRWLEEQSQTELHDAVSGLALHSAKCGVVGIIVNLPVVRVVKDVQRFHAKLQIKVFALTEIELLQQSGICIEAARVADIGEYE